VNRLLRTLVKSFLNGFDLFRSHLQSTAHPVFLLTSMLQQILMPMHSCVSVQWIMATLLAKLALNSNKKLEFC
jgi:hypothetical protein